MKYFIGWFLFCAAMAVLVFAAVVWAVSHFAAKVW